MAEYLVRWWRGLLREGWGLSMCLWPVCNDQGLIGDGSCEGNQCQIYWPEVLMPRAVSLKCTIFSYASPAFLDLSFLFISPQHFAAWRKSNWLVNTATASTTEKNRSYFSLFHVMRYQSACFHYKSCVITICIMYCLPTFHTDSWLSGLRHPYPPADTCVFLADV